MPRPVKVAWSDPSGTGTDTASPPRRRSKAARGDHPSGSRVGRPWGESGVRRTGVSSVSASASIDTTRPSSPGGGRVSGGSSPPPTPSVTGSPSGVSRASIITVPTSGVTATSRSTAVRSAWLDRTRTSGSPVRKRNRPRSSVVAAWGPDGPSSATVAPWIGSEVSSARTWPTTTPSPATLTPSDAEARLPATSVAVASTTRVEPAGVPGGARISKTRGAGPDATVTPSIRTSTVTAPGRLSTAVIRPPSGLPGATVSGTRVSRVGGNESTVTMV